MPRKQFLRLVFGLLGLLFTSHVSATAQFDSLTINKSLTGLLALLGIRTAGLYSQ